MHRQMSCCLLTVLLASTVSTANAANPLAIRVEAPIPLADNAGDTWVAAWAADGAVYSPSDDTKGFHAAANSNIAFNKVIGDDVRKLSGVTVNPMSDYGKGGAKRCRRLHVEIERLLLPGRDDLLGRRTAQVRRGFRRSQAASTGCQRQHHQVERLRQDVDPLGQGELRPADVSRQPFCRALLRRVRAGWAGVGGQRRPLRLCPFQRRLLGQRQQSDSRPRRTVENRRSQGDRLAVLPGRRRHGGLGVDVRHGAGRSWCSMRRASWA